MIPFEQCLANILSAVYGKDVRQSIHDGLKAGYEIATESKEISENGREIAKEAKEIALGARTDVDQAVERIEEAVENAGEAALLARQEATNAKRAAAAANTAADKVHDLESDLREKVENGYFTGPQGPQGLQGPQGESGIITEIRGMFTLSVDENGDLWVHYTDADTPPEFEYDSETGNVYYIISDVA